MASAARPSNSTCPRHWEWQYLDLMRRIWTEGDERLDRTGIGTRALFGTHAALRLVGRPRAAADHQAGVLESRRARDAVVPHRRAPTSARCLQQGVTIWSDWPLAKYRRETGEEIAQEDFERRIVEDADVRRAVGRSRAGLRQAMGRLADLRARPATGSSSAGRASTRSPKWSKACGPTPAAGVTSSKAGTSPNSTGWRCRRATRPTSSTSRATGFRACSTSAAATSCWACHSTCSARRC